MYEQQHDEALLRAMDQPDPLVEGPVEGTDVDQDTEPLTGVDSDREDLMEDTEPLEDDDSEEDPSEEDPIEDTELPADEDPVEEDPEETLDEEVPTGVDADMPYEADDEAPADESDEDGDERTDALMHPLPAVRSPSPPPLPLSPLDDDFEDSASDDQEFEDAPPSEPDTPPPGAVEGVPLHMHNMIVHTLGAELATAEARLGEARRELDTERAARFAFQHDRQAAIPRRARRELTSIEMRARTSLRALRGDGEGRISRAEAEEIFRRAMRRVRDLTRY